MSLEKRNNRGSSLQYTGWMSEGLSLLPPVAGGVFFLTSPYIERGYRKLSHYRNSHPYRTDSGINTGGRRSYGWVTTEEVHEACPDIRFSNFCLGGNARCSAEGNRACAAKTAAGNCAEDRGHAKGAGVFHVLLGCARRKNLAANRQMEHGILICRIIAERRGIERHWARP